jgi:hypothetical protein
MVLLRSVLLKRAPRLTIVCFIDYYYDYYYTDLRRLVTEPTDGVMSLVFEELANVRGKLVVAAEGCLPDLGVDPKAMADLQRRTNIITDETNLREYFLNCWDPVRGKVLVFSSPAFFRLHREFWFGRNSPFLDPRWEMLIQKPSWYMYGLTGAAVSQFFHVLQHY